MLNLNCINTKSQVVFSTQVSVFKRYVGGKEIGHAHKVLGSVHKASHSASTSPATRLVRSRSDSQLISNTQKSSWGGVLDHSLGLRSRSNSVSYQHNGLIQRGGVSRTQVTSSQNQGIGREVQRTSYATWHIRTPSVMCDTHEQTQNNEIVDMPNTKKKYVQHPEISRITCHIPGCNNYMCLNLCGKLESAKGVGHVTHHVPVNNQSSNPDPTPHSNVKVGETVISSDGKPFVKISKIDLTGKPSDQYARFYPVPHDINPIDINKERTEDLNKDTEAMEQILKHAK